MKILYVASDQRVPGSTGGSVHVLEVARGLAARGHEVHAVVHAAPKGDAPPPAPGLHWHAVSWTPPHRFFRFRARTAVQSIAERVAPDVIMERYYNFGGEGVLSAEALGLPALLEVNSPVVDHAASLKAALDALLIVRPFQRRRERMCRVARAIVSPLREIVPTFAQQKTEVVTWGANVDLFRPDRRREDVRAQLALEGDRVGVLFSGSFRPWHGVDTLERAARRLRHRRDIQFIFVGGSHDGPADGYHGTHLGRVPYDRMPEIVAAADIGVAPYDTRRLRQLSLGFYWSPLKIFEYMASALPTITIDRAPLNAIVRDGQEGLLFPENDDRTLAAQIERLADDRATRERLGRQARARVVEGFSWSRHCEQLERVLERIVS